MDTENWWIDICMKNDFDKWSGGYETINESKKILSKLDNESKDILINYLTDIAINKGHRYSLALAILVEFINDYSLNKIYQIVLKLKDNYVQDEHYYIDLLNIIGGNANDYRLDLVRDYLFAPKYNSKQSFIHWSLWPNNKELFCQAYTQYFENEKKWTECAIVQAFMHNSNALSELKNYLLMNKKNRIWETLKNDLKKELLKDFWNEKDKKKVRELL